MSGEYGVPRELHEARMFAKDALAEASAYEEVEGFLNDIAGQYRENGNRGKADSIESYIENLRSEGDVGFGLDLVGSDVFDAFKDAERQIASAEDPEKAYEDILDKEVEAGRFDEFGELVEERDLYKRAVGRFRDLTDDLRRFGVSVVGSGMPVGMPRGYGGERGEEHGPSEGPPGEGTEGGVESGEGAGAGIELLNLNRGMGGSAYQEVLEDLDEGEREEMRESVAPEYRDNFDQDSILSFLDTGDVSGSYAIRLDEDLMDEADTVRIEGGVPAEAYEFDDGTSTAFFDGGPDVYEQAVDEMGATGGFLYDLDGLPINEEGDHWYRAKVLDEDGEVLAETREDDNPQMYDWTTWDVGTKTINDLWKDAKSAWGDWNGDTTFLVGADTGTAHYDPDESGGPWHQAHKEQVGKYKKAAGYSAESDFAMDLLAHTVFDGIKSMISR